jgi:hypothetical protein
MAFDPSTAVDVFDPATATNVEGEFIDPRIPTELEEQAKRKAQLFGLATGAVKPGLKMVGAGLQEAGRQVRLGQASADQSIEAARQARVLQGSGVEPVDTTGRQRQGYNEITHQQAERAKQQAGIIEQLQKQGNVAKTAGQVVSDYGGIGVTPAGVITTRAVDIPAKQSGLEQVRQMFTNAARTGLSTALSGLKFIAPPLAVAGGFGEAADIGKQMDRPPEQRDIPGMGLSGLGILGAGMSLFPKTSLPGLALGVGAPAVQSIREHMARMESDPQYAERYRNAASRAGQESYVRFP